MLIGLKNENRPFQLPETTHFWLQQLQFEWKEIITVADCLMWQLRQSIFQISWKTVCSICWCISSKL